MTVERLPDPLLTGWRLDFYVSDCVDDTISSAAGFLGTRRTK
jgi:hypothetical protein